MYGLTSKIGMAERRKGYGGKRYDVYYPESQFGADLAIKLKYPKEALDNPVDYFLGYMLNSAVSTVGASLDSPEHRILLSEYAMKLRKNTTLFVPSKELPQAFYESTFDINEDSLNVPFGGFMSIAFRRGIVVDGVRIRGCMITNMSESQVRDYTNSLFKAHTPPAVNKALDKLKDHPILYKQAQEYARASVARDNERLGITPERIKKTKGAHVIHLICVGDDGYTLVQHLATVDIVKVLVDGEMGGNISHSSLPGLSDTERHTLYVHLRLCMGVCCYVSAFPKAITPGAPNDFKEGVQSPRKNEFTRTLVCGEHDDNSKYTLHFRRGHFATLRHERYHKDDKGRPRMIFKRSCVVGSDIDPYTLKERRRNQNKVGV